MADNEYLRAIEFTKYRTFERKQHLELRPITLLFGHNSAGKSAALRLLPILAASILRKGLGSAVLDYSSPALRDALFRDLVHNGSASGFNFGFNWDDVKYDLFVSHLGEGGEVVAGFDVQFSDGLSLSGGPSKTEVRDSFEVKSGGESFLWKLDGLNPVDAATKDGSRMAALLRDRLERFASSVHWLGAVRAAVPRVFELRPGADGKIRHDGSGVAEAIRISAAANDGAADAVSKWLEKTCHCKLSFAESDGTVAFHRQFFPFNVITSADKPVAVRDVGEGVAQALPVVMLCHQARLGHLGPRPVLAFEQPELHLHPKASVHLANEIIGCISQGSAAAHVIETHSESMLLSVQIAIVEGKIPPKDVIVYWVSADGSSTSLRPITFDSAGFAMGGWPQGVFREALEQARRLAQLRIDSSAS